jgi:hypothetical protein
MVAKRKNPLRWIAATTLVSWFFPLLHMHEPLWKALWFCLLVIYVGAFWVLSRGSDIDTEAGLKRATNVMLGLMVVQIAVMFFIAFQAAGAR